VPTPLCLHRSAAPPRHWFSRSPPVLCSRGHCRAFVLAVTAGPPALSALGRWQVPGLVVAAGPLFSSSLPVLGSRSLPVPRSRGHCKSLVLVVTASPSALPAADGPSVLVVAGGPSAPAYRGLLRLRRHSFAYSGPLRLWRASPPMASLLASVGSRSPLTAPPPPMGRSRHVSWVITATRHVQGPRAQASDRIYRLMSGALRSWGHLNRRQFHDHGSLMPYIDVFDP
jgi:hypothetical protein